MKITDEEIWEVLDRPHPPDIVDAFKENCRNLAKHFYQKGQADLRDALTGKREEIQNVLDSLITVDDNCRTISKVDQVLAIINKEDLNG